MMTQPIDMERLTQKQRRLLADLTPAQQEAVTHVEGPLLILAAAGSGKTRVITRRVAYLLDQGIRPYNVLAITFTNKAAAEMRQRVQAQAPNSRVWISTFHALGARLLRQYGERLGLDRKFTIYDQTDRLRVIKLAMEDANVDNGRTRPDAIQAAISKAKNKLRGPERYGAGDTGYFAEVVGKVYPAYEKRLRDCNALDFDDLLYWPALALRNDAELRAELDQRFQYVMIDEYQDTNHAQYVLAQALSVDHPNLCVVGDPDQSIYGWRGADIKNILNFERDFPQARVLTLTTNYRSTKAILEAADALITHNSKRKPKDLVTDNSDGRPVQVLTFEMSSDEADGIVRRIRDAVGNGQTRSYRDHAIFLRVNALSRSFEKAFIRHRVPYQIVRGLAFFDRKENRDVLAYLRVLVNSKDDVSFERIINEPPRGMGKVSLAHLRLYAERNDVSMTEAAHAYEKIPEIKNKAARGLRDFSVMIRELSELVQEIPPEELIEKVLRRSGYRKMLLDSVKEEDQDRLANVEELITAAREFGDEDPEHTIIEFLESVTLTGDVDGWDEEQDCVSIMTLHASKGLEFPVVFMAAVENSILPHERSLDSKHKDQLEEERRLAFVGMTRAKEELYLSHVRMRDYRGMTLYAIPSMFLAEMPASVEEVDCSSAIGYAHQWPNAADDFVHDPPKGKTGRELSAGMLVRHERHGRGEVVDVLGQGVLRRVKIRFKSGEERTLLVDKVRLEIIANEA